MNPTHASSNRAPVNALLGQRSRRPKGTKPSTFSDYLAAAVDAYKRQPELTEELMRPKWALARADLQRAELEAEVRRLRAQIKEPLPDRVTLAPACAAEETDA